MEDNGKKMIIIGGGIAGLCAGVYARKAGFATQIFEMHKIAGGLATAWARGGYVFENCIHWLVGSKKGGDLNGWWREVFDIDRIKFYESPIQSILEVIRYTNNWKGSMEGWLLTPKTGAKQLPCTIQGIKNFYMVGQWISPGGGLPSGLITARNVIAKITREAKKA